MVRCKVTQCPFIENEFCAKRVPSINEYGFCAVLYRGQQRRNIGYGESGFYIKNPITRAEGHLVECQDEPEDLGNGVAASQNENKENTEKQG